MKWTFLPLFVALQTIAFLSSAQKIVEGFVLGVEKDLVYLDLGSSVVGVGAKFNVVTQGGFFIHPKSGDTIRLKDEVVATVVISAAYEKYSEATVDPPASIDKIEPGMKVVPSGEATPAPVNPAPAAAKTPAAGKFNAGDTVFFHTGPPGNDIIPCIIIISYPGSNEAQIRLIEDGREGKIIKVAHRLILDPQRSASHCILGDIKSLSIGQKVIIFNGYEFTEGTIVSPPGNLFVDISFEKKVGYGNTRVYTDNFQKSVILVSRYDEKTGCYSCNCFKGKPEKKETPPPVAAPAVPEQPPVNDEEARLRRILSKNPVVEEISQANGSNITLTLNMQGDGTFRYRLLIVFPVNSSLNNFFSATGNYSLKEGTPEGKAIIEFKGRRDDGSPFELLGSLTKEGDRLSLFTFESFSSSAQMPLGMNNYRLPSKRLTID